MRMGQSRPGRSAVVLEDQDVTEAHVVQEIGHPIAIGVDHFDHLARAVLAGLLIVRRRFDHDLVRADAAHPVVEPFGLLVEAPFDPEGRIAVRDDPHAPFLGTLVSVVRTIGEHFGRSHPLVAGAEGTGFPRSDRRGVPAERAGAMTTLARDDHPPSDDWILAQLRCHGLSTRSRSGPGAGSRSESDRNVTVIPALRRRLPPEPRGQHSATSVP